MHASRPQPEIRSGTIADVPTVATLHAQCFDCGWNHEFLASLLAQQGTSLFLAEDQTRPIGFVISRAVAGEAEILSLGVVPDQRDKGVGRALVRTTVSRALAGGAAVMFLEVSVENLAARTLYGALGFSEVGRRPGYYAEFGTRGGDALLLRRNLPF